MAPGLSAHTSTPHQPDSDWFSFHSGILALFAVWQLTTDTDPSFWAHSHCEAFLELAQIGKKFFKANLSLLTYLRQCTNAYNFFFFCVLEGSGLVILCVCWRCITNRLLEFPSTVWVKSKNTLRRSQMSLCIHSISRICTQAQKNGCSQYIPFKTDTNNFKMFSQNEELLLTSQAEMQ